jgi:hypothetical protein
MTATDITRVKLMSKEEANQTVDRVFRDKREWWDTAWFREWVRLARNALGGKRSEFAKPGGL